ncbi:MAG: hypothetical protein IPL75_22675 [Acidobacteria bacterium]|nr:hypothetical protein [Acidobacteriota bacterium]
MFPTRFLLALACALIPASADAQWAFSTYTGNNHTRPSSISIDRPDVGQSLTFDDVHYDAKPFDNAPYYGVRLTRFFGGERRFGVEVELLHSKVLARTRDVVQVRGTAAGVAINGLLPMSTFVNRYNHTHGLNFLLANVVLRQPLGDPTSRVALLVRGGAGPVIPGRDVVAPGLNVQGYEFAGIGAQAAAGVTARLTSMLSAMVEYKFTYARPEIDLTAGGRGRLTAASHHIAVGLTIGR